MTPRREDRIRRRRLPVEDIPSNTLPMHQDSLGVETPDKRDPSIPATLTSFLPIYCLQRHKIPFKEIQCRR